MARRVTRFAWSMLAPLIVAINLYLAMLLVQHLEPKIFPVITDMSVDYVRHTADGDSTVGGHWSKQRDCRFLGMTAHNLDGLPVLAQYAGLPSGEWQPRPVGDGPWGPWRIHAQTEVRAYLHYRCHALWTHLEAAPVFDLSKPREVQ